MAFIREYQESDFEDVVEICKLTAHPSIHSSADIIPYIYAIPYIRLEPTHVLVLDAGSSENTSGRNVVGYVIGAPNTNNFVERYRKEYIPTLPPSITTSTTVAADKGWDRDQELRRMFARVLLDPEEMLHPTAPGFIQHFPAHLHINILPEFQGRGSGGKLMEGFLHGVRAMGACGVHLGMRRDNVGARRFYERYGFTEHEGLSDGNTSWMVEGLVEEEGGEGKGEGEGGTGTV